MLPTSGNILIVDDNRDDLRLLADILIERGHKVRPALDGTAALTAACFAPPDLIILDVQMPKMDGYATCQQLKADERTRDIPVIFISARDKLFDKVTAFATGGIDYISKPYEAEEVVARIENQLRLYNMQQHLEIQNHLLQQEIEERTRIEAELKRHQDHLEELVDARTTELQSTNAWLQDEITERKRAEAEVQAHAENLSKINAELTRVLRLKDEFLAMMSHELRTPLNAILSISESMKEEFYGPIGGRQHQALTSIVQSGRHLLDILADILDLAHIEAGAAKLYPQLIDVDELCRLAVQFVQPTAQQKGIHLLRTVETGIRGLYADERRLTQILINLLENAVKFTPAGGKVGLEATVDPARELITFTIWDTGIGIAEADYDRLFQPFTQVDGRLSRQYEGIGLGLTLVRRLVDMHGGSISLESAPGQGSRFTISLPWDAGSSTTLSEPAAAESLSRAWLQSPRVLIADDHEISLQLYTKMLRRQGCQVMVARTGIEVLTQLHTGRPDIAVLDMQMPEMDGLATIRHIRADPTLATIPIIALTALAMPGDQSRYLEAGASAYLTKPISLHTLIETITAMLTPA